MSRLDGGALEAEELRSRTTELEGMAARLQAELEEKNSELERARAERQTWLNADNGHDDQKLAVKVWRFCTFFILIYFIILIIYFGKVSIFF